MGEFYIYISFLLPMLLVAFGGRRWLPPGRSLDFIHIENLKRSCLHTISFPRRLAWDLSGSVTKSKRGDPQLIPFGVVGVVDIVSSTQISNSLDIFAEWQLKSRFFELALAHAREAGMTIINNTGDGFVFLVDQSNSPDWANALIWFYERLVSDFRSAIQALDVGLPQVDSGLRFGVAAGTLLVGRSAVYGPGSCVVGSDVNLAARLCDQAGINEMVISSRVWDVLKHATAENRVQKKLHRSMKGFPHGVPAMHWAPRTLEQTDADALLASFEQEADVINLRN